jgi:hypothetical protein
MLPLRTQPDAGGRYSILSLDTAPILSMRIAAFGSPREISDESKTS